MAKKKIDPVIPDSVVQENPVIQESSVMTVEQEPQEEFKAFPKEYYLYFAVLMTLLAFWHPIIVLVTYPVAILWHFKVFPFGPSGPVEDSGDSLKNLVAGYQRSATNLNGKSVDFVHGVRVANKNRTKILKAIKDKKASVSVFVGFPTSLYETKKGIASELGIDASNISLGFPLFLDIDLL